VSYCPPFLFLFFTCHSFPLFLFLSSPSLSFDLNLPPCLFLLSLPSPFYSFSLSPPSHTHILHISLSLDFIHSSILLLKKTFLNLGWRDLSILPSFKKSYSESKRVENLPNFWIEVLGSKVKFNNFLFIFSNCKSYHGISCHLIALARWSVKLGLRHNSFITF